jgi:hypothetical protein
VTQERGEHHRSSRVDEIVEVLECRHLMKRHGRQMAAGDWAPFQLLVDDLFVSLALLPFLRNQ